MSEAPSFYVITLRGDRGPMTRQALAELRRTGEIADDNHVRNAFGRQLGTVAEVLGADARRQTAGARASARGTVPRPRPPAQLPTRQLLPLAIAAALGLCVIIAMLLAAGPSRPTVVPPMPQPKPAAIAPPKPAAPAVPSQVQPSLRPGLVVEIFQLNYLPEDFPALSPAARPDWNGVVQEVSGNVCERNGFRENFYARWRGYLDVFKPGRYTFFLTSDDGSRLTINDRIVVDNNGSHAMRLQTGSCDLGPGRHPIRIDFFQGDGGFGLKLDWQLDGFDRTPLPGTVMGH